MNKITVKQPDGQLNFSYLNKGDFFVPLYWNNKTVLLRTQDGIVSLANGEYIPNEGLGSQPFHEGVKLLPKDTIVTIKIGGE